MKMRATLLDCGRKAAAFSSSPYDVASKESPAMAGVAAPAVQSVSCAAAVRKQALPATEFCHEVTLEYVRHGAAFPFPMTRPERWWHVFLKRYREE